MTAVTMQGLTIHSLAGAIPPARAAHFLRAAGGNAARALALHDWNEDMGAAFYSPLQKAELVLRVRVESALAATWGSTWFTHPDFVKNADWAGRNEIAAATHRLMAKGVPVDRDGLMDKASFGLWVGLLRPVFNPPVWMSQLRTAFPALPAGQGRHALAALASRAVNLRNRIDHHEPLIGLDLSRYHSDVMTLLEWNDPALASRARAASTVRQLLRAKP